MACDLELTHPIQVIGRAGRIGGHDSALVPHEPAGVAAFKRTEAMRPTNHIGSGSVSSGRAIPD
jgi:hypothetical protein